MADRTKTKLCIFAIFSVKGRSPVKPVKNFVKLLVMMVKKRVSKLVLESLLFEF